VFYNFSQQHYDLVMERGYNINDIGNFIKVWLWEWK
jgi:hypothetical protein